MKLPILIICAVFSSLLTLWIPSASAADKEGTETVRKINSTISTMLAKKITSEKEEERLLAEARVLLGDFLNIEELGQRAMKDHWSKLNPKQRKEFLVLLRNLIETNYVKGLRANVKYKVSYKGEEKQGDYLLVKTVVKSERKGRPLKIEIDYLLSKSGNSWRTFDMTTDGIGLIENYRAMFNKIIGKSGFDALIKKMQRKLDAMSL